MKVKELIKELSKYDGDKEVTVYDWTTGSVHKATGFDLYDVDDDPNKEDNHLSINFYSGKEED